MGRKIRILIVDDDQRLLSRLKLWLESKEDGFTVITVDTADKALTIADQEWLHVAIIDILLKPNIDQDRSGFDLARKMWEGIPKIFLTTLTDYGSTKEAGFGMTGHGVVGYVDKEEGEQRLLKVIRETVATLNLGLAVQWHNYSPRLLVEMLKGSRAKSETERTAAAEELENLFCYSFRNAKSPESSPKSIELIDVKRGKGGCAVARIRPTLSEGLGAATMVKFGPRATIEREWKNYEDYVRDHLDFGSTTVKDEPAKTLHLGAIKYSFIGGEEIVGSLQDFYPKATSRELDRLFTHIFDGVCKNWFEGRRRPKEHEQQNSDTWYRSANSLNLSDAKHIQELKTAVERLLQPADNPYAVNLKKEGEHHIKLNLGSFDELLPNPMAIAIANGTADMRMQEVLTPPSLISITHGDLNAENILVSKDIRAFLIDFYKTGLSPIFRDFVALESILKFELFQSSNLFERYQVESALLQPRSFSDSISAEHFEPNEQAKKVIIGVRRLRELAAQIGPGNDMREYYVGLLYYALKEIMGFSSVTDEPSHCDIKQFHALLSAAKICEKLLNGLRQVPPATDIKIFLIYASEDRTFARMLYDRLAGEGFSPWMDTQNIFGGENWSRAIDHALQTSHVVLPVLTKNSLNKRGVLQTEIKTALELSRRRLAVDIHIIPLLVDAECVLPEELKHLQAISWSEANGWERLCWAIHESNRRLQASS